MYGVFCVAAVLTVVSSASLSIIEPRIVGGYDTSIEEHPYQVSLLEENWHICGACILGPKFIVSAAHCFKLSYDHPLFTYEVRFGSQRKNKDGTKIEVKSIFQHPDYTSTYQYDSDIAVATLQTGIELGTTAQPITLVPINEEPKEGSVVTISGWGDISGLDFDDDFVMPATELQAANLTITNRDDCQRFMPVFLTKNMICAGRKGKSIFKGDSGGPLVNEKEQLVGIASFISMQNPLITSSVYTNIASPSIHNFITEHFLESQDHDNMQFA